MRFKRQRIDPKEASVVACVFGAVSLLTPARRLWSFPGAPWWSPLALWLVLLALGLWVAQQDPES